MKTFRELIDEKTVEQIATVCGVAQSTVYYWRSNNRIPREGPEGRDYWTPMIKQWRALTYQRLQAISEASRQVA
jgi:hypothetical protein